MKKLFTYLSGVILLCCLLKPAYAQNDTISPVVLDFTVEFQETGINDSVDAVFTLTYSEDIQLVDTFTIVTHSYNNMVWEEYDRYDTTEIVIEGNVLTITPERSFWATDRYELVVTSGSIQDLAMNKAGSFARTFVADEDVPEVISHSIEFTQEAMNDSFSAVFTLTYSEDIQLNDTFQVVTHILTENVWTENDRYDESEVVVDGSTMTITPTGLFSATDMYELVVTFGSVTDLAGNIATSFTRVFMTDVTPPEAVVLNTEFTDTEFADSLGAIFTLTYNEDVKLAPTYSFLTYHHSQGQWQEYEIIADTNIMVSGHTVTLHPERLFSTTQTYELVVVAGSIRDLADNPATSFTEIFLLDTIRPQLIEISPDLNMPVPTNAIFTFIFDENVRLADDFGFYTYHWDADSAKYIEYEQLDASQATVEKNVVTFDPSMDFRPGEQVQIVLNSGSVLDMEGNRFQFPRENDTLNYVSERFRTAESGVTYVTFLPGNEDSLSYIPGELTISFSDAITLTDTTAVDSLSLDTLVYLQSGGVDLEHVASYDSSTNIITIIPQEELAWGSSYTYGFADGFLNEEMDSIAAAEVTFTILDSMVVIDEFTIAEINGEGMVSPDPGQVVRINGTITGIYPNEGFFIQDSVEIYSGIWVEHAAAADYTIGDGVYVTGMVDTLQGVTSFIAEEVTAADLAVSIFPLVYEFDTDFIQMYRNVLVQIINARASEAGENGEWVLYAENETDSVVVSSKMFAFSPADSGYYNVTGIVTAWDSIYRVEPRMETDIAEVTEEFVAIAEIYGEEDTSPYLGEEVQISGTVTAVYEDEGFYVQDENAPMGGIWVEYTDTLQLEIGNGVTVAGTVNEMDGTAYITAQEVNTVAAPIVIEPIVLDFTTDSIAMYQGVLVQIADARASAADPNGVWTLYSDDPMDSVIVSSRLYAFSPVADNVYDVTGVVTFRDSVYRIEPRMEADVSFVTSVDLTPDVSFNVYPNPFNNYIKISNNNKLTRVIISNIAGQRVIDVTDPTAEISTSQLISGVYIINMFSEDKLVKTSRIVKQ